MINALNNCLFFNSNSSEKLLIDDEIFIEKFTSLLKEGKILKSSLKLLCTFSLKSDYSVKFIFSNLNVFSLLNRIINSIEVISYLNPILKFLNNVAKSQTYYDKFNLSVFLFLMKKLLTSKLNQEEYKGDELLDDQELNNNIIKESIYNNKLSQVNTGKIVYNDGKSVISNKDLTLARYNSLGENNYSVRIEILKVIKSYLKIEFFSSTLRSIIEMYLPSKIVEMIFSNKEISEETLDWIDKTYEYPDLIWNEASFKKSLSLIEEDCQFVLNDEKNLVNFPQNLFEYKLDPHKSFFFEISQEYIIDNIYVRVFNKYPSYNISKPLIIFLKHVCNSYFTTFDYYLISTYILKRFNFLKFKQNLEVDDCKDEITITSDKNINKLVKYNEIKDSNENKDQENLNINSKKHDLFDSLSYQDLVEIELINEKLYSKTIIGLTSVMLILEQVFLNDFNENILVTSTDDLLEINKNLVKDENEKLIINLVQRSLDNKKILNNKFTSVLLDFISSCFYHKTSDCIDSSLKIILLQIIYLFTLHKDFVQLLDHIDYVKLVELELNKTDSIGDGKLNIN